MNISRQYNKIGKDYIDGQKKFFSKREDEAIKFIKKSLPHLKNKKILDIGCGNGKDIVMLESLGASAVYGIDTSTFMINQAKKIVSSPKNIFVANIDKTPFKNNFFDIIIGRFAINYINDINIAYRELSRILKKSGVMILVTHHPFRDLMCQLNKVYGKQEIIKLELYDNKVPILFPTHTLKNYFSKCFFDKFALIDYEEEQSPEEYVDKLQIPGFMGIKAKKK